MNLREERNRLLPTIHKSRHSYELYSYPSFHRFTSQYRKLSDDEEGEGESSTSFRSRNENLHWREDEDIERSWNDETFPETPRDVTALTLPPSSQFGRFSLAKTIGVVSFSLSLSALRTLPRRSFPPTVRRFPFSRFPSRQARNNREKGEGRRREREGLNG